MQRRHRDSRTIMQGVSIGLLACGLAYVTPSLAQIPELPNDDPVAVQYIFNKVAQARGAEKPLTAIEFAEDLGWCNESDADQICTLAYEKAMDTLGRARKKTDGTTPLCDGIPAQNQCVAHCGTLGVCPGLTTDAKLPSLADAELWWENYHTEADWKNQQTAEAANRATYAAEFHAADAPGRPDDIGKPRG